METSANADARSLPSRLDPALAHSRRVIETLFGPARERAFDVRYWDGTVERGRGDSRPFTFVIARAGALRAMLLPPSELSVVDAYLSGDVDIEGDLEAAISINDQISQRVHGARVIASLAHELLALPRHDAHAGEMRRARSERAVRAKGKPHEPTRDRAAIHYHYDVGNDFYKLWLDERMVYSCAYFETPTTSLDDAQRAKLDLVCRKLRLRPGERMLDIGCGWGALIIHAVQHYGVSAVGVTLSERQRVEATQRIEAAGIADRCRVDLRDYRDLASLGQFDKVGSVGMVEHVGVDHLPGYFDAAFGALEPGGLFLNHGIVSVDAAHQHSLRERVWRRLWRRDAFIDQYVFPDGKLGPYAAVIAAAEGAGFETRDAESLHDHYTMTLRHWVERLRRVEDRATAIVGERTFRVWRLYMTASARAFASGDLNVVQTLLSKPHRGQSILPLTRRDLYAG